MYEAMISDPSAEIQRVAIKKTEKILYSKRISIQNDMNIVTNENIIKVPDMLNMSHLCTFLRTFLYFISFAKDTI